MLLCGPAGDGGVQVSSVTCLTEAVLLIKPVYKIYSG